LVNEKDILRRDMRHKVDMEKAEKMLMYLSQCSKQDPKFGTVKLAKLMFYSDFAAFKELGKPITGLEYKKLPQGPVPTLAKSIQDSLIERGDLDEREGSFGRKQLRPTKRFNRKAFSETFTDDELAIMDRTYCAIRPLKAGEVSDLSHEFLGWELAQDGEVIPYATCLINPDRLTAKQRDYGEELIKKLGLAED
jgi:hypothetical protein